MHRQVRTLFRQRIDVRRWNGCVAETADIPITQVIDEKDDDIRLPVDTRLAARKRRDEADNKSKNRHP